MFFVRGFKKIADSSQAFTSRNDGGGEFKITDTEPAPYVAGAGGMAPSGIPSYKPNETGKVPWAPGRSKNQAEKQRALDIAMLSKMSDEKPTKKWIPFREYHKLRAELPENKEALKKMRSMHKVSSSGDPRDSTAYVGTSGQGSDTLVSQLKYESTSDNITESTGFDKKTDSPRSKRIKRTRKDSSR